MKASVPIGEWYLNSVPAGWVDARPESVPVPLARQHEDKHYWFTYLPEHRVVYFQFNLVINQDGETLADFAGRLATALEQPGVERLVCWSLLSVQRSTDAEGFSRLQDRRRFRQLRIS